MDRFCYAGFPRPLRPRMDVALLLFLVFLNALFAMSETALTASRKARLQVMVEAGDSGASHALALHDNPTKWLSVVQIGITSIGLLERHRRRGGVLDPARRLAALADRDQRPRRRALRARPRRHHHHLHQHRLRRARSQADRPDVSRDHRPAGRAADGVAVDADAAVHPACSRGAPTRRCRSSACETVPTAASPRKRSPPASRKGSTPA